MKSMSRYLLFIPILIFTSFSNAKPETLSDNEVKTEIIREYLTSHMKFTGPCPCPEIRDAVDSRCGARSAWSRKPDTGVLCYLEDVTPSMVEAWREQNKKPRVLPPRVKTDKEIKIDNKINDYLNKYVVGKVTEPDELNFKGLKIDDTKTEGVKKEGDKKEG
ncbi:hypothetical protein [Sodalis sp. RH22]|uniref:hypothetical protein n=1 Tax=unclassified Sodalis (in: enterobacteria) TaxID=2636512 RepID=UPI0039B69529